MPEQPEVRSVRDRLYPDVVGKLILQLTWDQKSRFHKNPIPGFSLIQDKFPAYIRDLDVRGKKLLFTFESTIDQTSFYAWSSLGMEGKWKWSPGNHSNLWMVIGELRPRMRIIHRILYYDDSRHYGTMAFFDNHDLYWKDLKSKVGPDILAYELYTRGILPHLPEDEHLTPERWNAILRNKRLQNKRIAEFLLDQKNVSAAGNYLRAELLYQSKINPYRTLGSLSDHDIEQLRVAALDVNYRSYISQGHTLRSYSDPYGKKGEFVCVVYMQKQCPEGHPVIQEKDKQGRMIHWVPNIQV